MLDLDAILKATDILTTLSVADSWVLLQYEGKLTDALQAPQRTVEAVRAVRIGPARSDGTASASPSPSFSSPASSPQPAGIDGYESTHNGCPTSPSDSDDRPINHGTDGIETDLSSDDKTKPRSSKVSELCLYLNDKKRSAAIQNYLCSTPDFDEMCAWKSGDPRVTDISICSSPGNTHETGLRRGLSQRSLAIEFDQWEKATFDMSRVNEISRNLELSAKRTGHLDKFIQAKEFKDKEAENASMGIRHGIKWLVFESIYGYEGVSLVLMLVYSRFRDVKYEEFFQLKESLTDWKEFAIGKSSCLGEWQKCYERTSTYTKGGILSDPHTR